MAALPTAEVAHEVEVPTVVDAVEDSHNTSITEPLKKRYNDYFKNQRIEPQIRAKKKNTKSEAEPRKQFCSGAPIFYLLKSWM